MAGEAAPQVHKRLDKESAMADTKGSQAGGPAPTDPLTKFLADLEKLPNAAVEGMLKQSTDRDEGEVIRGVGATLQRQLSELGGYLRDRAGRLSLQQTQEIEQILRLSAADTLVAGALRLTGNLASPAAKIGLAGFFRELKKIILIILYRIFGDRLPGWIFIYLLLIDEHWNLLLSTGSTRLAGVLSRMEQDYLGELMQLTRLTRENQRIGTQDEEEA
jgi:hypothetical protein